MRRRIAFGWLGSLTIFSSAFAGSPTYHKDVLPILQKNCQDCHRPGQVAPFSLLTYEQARKRGADLAHVTSQRLMPPWPAAPNPEHPFRDERVLTEAEIRTLNAWSEAGCPEGDSKDAPPPREFSSAWPLGEPDLVLTMDEPYELAASGDDDFRAFVLKTNFTEDRWIRAVDFQPGNRKVVHHVIAGIDTSGKARELDAKDPGAGYTSVGGFGPGVPLRGFLPIWTPGSRPRFAVDGSGYLLPAGADVLIQVHYHKSGKPETDATSIGLYLSDKPLSNQVKTGFVFPTIPSDKLVAMMAKAQKMRAEGKRPELEDFFGDVLVIPAGETNYTVTGDTKSSMMGRPIGRDILLTSVMPHMHWLGRDFVLTAILPDKTRMPLIQIEHWNFNWQGTYAFAEPIRLPKGTYFEMVAHFDNSADNPANQNKPPKTVHWGEQTNDEMCIGIFEFVNAEADKPKDKPKTEGAAGQ
jgi:hypothetical protein